MKQNSCALSVVYLIVIYCFAIFHSVNLNCLAPLQSNNVLTQENISSKFSHIFYINTSQLSNSVNSFINHPSTGFKNSFKAGWLSIKFTQHLIDTVFFQYTRFFRSTPIQDLKLDILFPFHSFW
jgi:hypothetical protein